MALCRELKITATITLNAGTGTPEDAALWVEYFAGQGFDVASYAVGNEIYMADKNDPVKELPINKTPREYVDFFLQCKAVVDARSTRHQTRCHRFARYRQHPSQQTSRLDEDDTWRVG